MPGWLTSWKQHDPAPKVKVNWTWERERVPLSPGPRSHPICPVQREQCDDSQAGLPSHSGPCLLCSLSSQGSHSMSSVWISSQAMSIVVPERSPYFVPKEGWGAACCPWESPAKASEALFLGFDACCAPWILTAATSLPGMRLESSLKSGSRWSWEPLSQRASDGKNSELHRTLALLQTSGLIEGWRIGAGRWLWALQVPFPFLPLPKYLSETEFC